MAHASTNAVHGSLEDTSLDRLLELCRERMLTGKIELTTDVGPGHVELRAGMIDRAHLSGCTDDIALERLRALDRGSYVVIQRLPELDGALGSAAEFQGDIESLSLVAVMRHCEQNALTCTLTIINDFDRAEVVYRAGEIVRVLYNGEPDEDRIVDIVRFQNARFKVSAPPLDIGPGRPVMRRARTEPFTIAHLRNHFEPVRDHEALQSRPDVYAGDEPRFQVEPEPERASWSTRLRRRLAASLRALGDWLESARFDTSTERWRRAVSRKSR